MIKDNEEGKYHDMHQYWLRQLMLEFDNICFSYRVHLRPPVFEISESKSKVGEWNPAARTIKISQNLIVENSWSVVIHVLKHEMAHQYCTEMMQDHGKPHGEDFQRGCDLLGVPLEYRTARADLHSVVAADGFAAPSVEGGRKFLQRLEKLLALSQSGNEHEAALAMQKAQELAQKYHCYPDADGKPSNFTYLVIDKKRKRLAGYLRRICMILNDFFMVRVIISVRYDPIANDMYRIMELLGTRENLTIAEYCYYFLENQLKILWQTNKRRINSRSHRSMQNSYYLGVLHGFAEHLRLRSTHRPAEVSRPGVRALIEIKEGMLNEYVAMRFPRLRRGSTRKITVKSCAFQEGVESGKELRFTQGVQASNKEFGGYLKEAIERE